MYVFRQVLKIIGHLFFNVKIVVDVLVQSDLSFEFYRKSYDRFSKRRRFRNFRNSASRLFLQNCFLKIVFRKYFAHGYNFDTRVVLWLKDQNTPRYKYMLFIKHQLSIYFL
jgi:hypothetical protein